MRIAELVDIALPRLERRWKPGTRTIARSYLRTQILPWWGDLDVAAVTRGDARRWMAARRGTPSAANRARPILSAIFREAEIMGLREEDTNPCRGLRSHRVAPRERFLTDAELRRLGAALAARAGDPAADLIRLLALTGCRQGELRALPRDDYREGHLHLRDSKSGPRTVWLSAPARRLLDAQRGSGPWIFAGARGGPMPTETLYRRWRETREAAGLGALRLHDLRHSYASFALRRGETVLTIGRLLGHSDPQTTLRYLHHDDDQAVEAAQTAAAAMEAAA